MRVERTDLSPTKIRLVISADGTELEPIKRHVLAHFRHQVQVPGFRAGTAPLEMVEKHADQKLLTDEFLEHALNGLYREAVKHQDIRPVGQPKVQLKKFVPYSDLQVEIESEIIGAVKIPDYKNIKLAKDPVKFSSAEINEVINTLRQRLAERKTVERPAKLGDEVVIDFAGTDTNGNPVGGADAKDFPLVLGSGSFIPGFEDHLLGAKAGTTKKFVIKFPADYAVAAMQSKEVNFEVTIKQVSELVLPKADNQFAAKAGPFKTLAELKADIKKQLAIERQTQNRRQYENRVISELVARSKVEIPEGMIDEDLQRLEEEEKRNLAYRGQTWQEHLAEEGVSEQQHRERQRPRAEDRIKAGIILSEIADKEGITVTTKEIDDRINLLKSQYHDQTMQAELDNPQARRDIEARIATEKTVAKLAEYASNKKPN